MLVVNPAFPQVTEAWFDPGYWGEKARLVDEGGRGAAWFLEAEPTNLVLRQYRRGGLVARISECHYLFAGQNRVRSVAEFELLSRLYDWNLPVPQPVAAWYQRTGLFYRAAILVERLPGTVAFGSEWKTLPHETWSEIGRVIRQFHDAGACHADLNCFNILLQGSRTVYLIDFDKGQIVDGSTVESRWKSANLERLHRSLTRQAMSPSDEACLERGWSALEQGYHAS